MTSLGFDLLDRHVVAGRADELAVDDGSTILTYARLLKHAAAVAGGLRVLGLSAGETLGVDLPPGADRVTVLCACLRLGALPGEDGALRVTLAGGVPTVAIPGADPVDLATVRRAGGSDPAGALADDADGFRDAAAAALPDVVPALLQGRPVSAR